MEVMNMHGLFDGLEAKFIGCSINSALFHNSLKMLLNIWATIVRIFVPKYFQKSPNLVTLS